MIVGEEEFSSFITKFGQENVGIASEERRVCSIGPQGKWEKVGEEEETDCCASFMA